MQGRGAYCHPEKECIERLGQKGLLERALRLRDVPFDPEQRAALLKELLDFAG